MLKFIFHPSSHATLELNFELIQSLLLTMSDFYLFYFIFLLLHLRHLADAFVQSDLQ